MPTDNLTVADIGAHQEELFAQRRAVEKFSAQYWALFDLASDWIEFTLGPVIRRGDDVPPWEGLPL